MTTEEQIAAVTDDDIRALRDEAKEHDDWMLEQTCNIALGETMWAGSEYYAAQRRAAAEQVVMNRISPLWNEPAVLL